MPERAVRIGVTVGTDADVTVSRCGASPPGEAQRVTAARRTTAASRFGIAGFDRPLFDECVDRLADGLQ